MHNSEKLFVGLLRESQAIKNIEHAQKNLNVVKIIFELADGTGSSPWKTFQKIINKGGRLFRSVE